MANLTKVLNEEIRRLAKKEIKIAITDLKDSHANFRQTISNLKKEMAGLKKENKRLASALQKISKTSSDNASKEIPDRVRITAKGIRALRSKWRMTQKDFARMLGVSMQSVVQWEAKEGNLPMRTKARTAYIALRGLGAREAWERLDQL